MVTRKVSAKVPVHLYSLKHFVCLEQTVPGLWVAGSWPVGNWIVGSWGSISYALCGASGDRSLSRTQGWLAQVGLGSALLQLLWGASTSESDVLAGSLSFELEEVAAFELLCIIRLRSHPCSVVC